MFWNAKYIARNWLINTLYTDSVRYDDLKSIKKEAFNANIFNLINAIN